MKIIVGTDILWLGSLLWIYCTIRYLINFNAKLQKMSAEGSNKEMDNEQDNEFEKEQATKGAVLPEDVPTATVQPFEGEGKAKSTLKQADVTLQRLTTADLKPVEHYKAMDVSHHLAMYSNTCSLRGGERGSQIIHNSPVNL